jgi:hypothetical protein
MYPSIRCSSNPCHGVPHGEPGLAKQTAGHVEEGLGVEGSDGTILVGVQRNQTVHAREAEGAIERSSWFQ